MCLGLDPNATQLPREAVRWDDRATWDRAPESRYVVIGLGTPDGYAGGKNGKVNTPACKSQESTVPDWLIQAHLAFWRLIFGKKGGR